MAKRGLNENQLKMIAVVSMVIDHIGYFLLPQVRLLRWIGRLAFPIFAYFIAEGCYYTRSIRRYFAQVAGMGLICTAAVAVADGRIYGNIMITFACSIMIVMLLRIHPLAGACACVVTLYLTMMIEIDYGFAGILIPVGCWAARVAVEKVQGRQERKPPQGSETEADRTRRSGQVVRAAQLAVLAAGLLILAFQLAPYQWMGLFTLPLLFLYDGTRGKKNLKWFFYLFYPLHILVIEAIAMVLRL